MKHVSKGTKVKCPQPAPGLEWAFQPKREITISARFATPEEEEKLMRERSVVGIFCFVIFALFIFRKVNQQHQENHLFEVNYKIGV